MDGLAPFSSRGGDSRRASLADGDRCPPLPRGVSRVSWLQPELGRGLELGKDD